MKDRNKKHANINSASFPYMLSSTYYFSAKQYKLTDYEFITSLKHVSINYGNYPALTFTDPSYLFINSFQILLLN